MITNAIFCIFDGKSMRLYKGALKKVTFTIAHPFAIGPQYVRHAYLWTVT